MASLVELVAPLTFVQVTAQAPARVDVTLPFPEGLRAWITREPHLVVEADLPEGGGARLTPQRGLGGALAAMSEVKVDDKGVDDAWVIGADDPGLILALVPELRGLVAWAPAIDVTPGHLRVVFADTVSEAHLGPAIEAALGLWHRAVFHRFTGAAG